MEKPMISVVRFTAEDVLTTSLVFSPKAYRAIETDYVQVGNEVIYTSGRVYTAWPIHGEGINYVDGIANDDELGDVLVSGNYYHFANARVGNDGLTFSSDWLTCIDPTHHSS